MYIHMYLNDPEMMVRYAMTSGTVEGMQYGAERGSNWPITSHKR
jgi:hypothetical protein